PDQGAEGARIHALGGEEVDEEAARDEEGGAPLREGVPVGLPERPRRLGRGLFEGRERRHVPSRRSRITRAGAPTAIAKAGMSSVTRAWAPITAWGPIDTPSRTIAPAPSQPPGPMSMPFEGRACRITGRSARSNS